MDRWVYVSDIFPTRTRHFGLATASASQWFFNFIVSKWTPAMKTALGYKLFLMFAAINIGGMAVFSLYVSPSLSLVLLPLLLSLKTSI